VRKIVKEMMTHSGNGENDLYVYIKAAIKQAKSSLCVAECFYFYMHCEQFAMQIDQLFATELDEVYCGNGSHEQKLNCQKSNNISMRHDFTVSINNLICAQIEDSELCKCESLIQSNLFEKMSIVFDQEIKKEMAIKKETDIKKDNTMKDTAINLFCQLELQFYDPKMPVQCKKNLLHLMRQVKMENNLDVEVLANDDNE